MKAFLYHVASGAVFGTVEGADDFSVYESPTVGVYLGEMDPATQYIDNGTPTAREVVVGITLPNTVDAGDTIQVTGLPSPCWVRFDGELREITGGSANVVARKPGLIEAELVGRYVARFECIVADPMESALALNPRWQALQAATPAQIDAWLTANVTDLASARQVLSLLILAVRRMAA